MKNKMEITENEIYNVDCLIGMKYLKDKSINMVLCDLPQGITQNRWDIIIPFDELWLQYNRIIKDNGAIVLFGNGIFTAQLMLSNPKLWRYNLIWQKTTPTGFLNANKMPLRVHEDICVFYKKLPTYNPQKTSGHKPVHSYTKHTSDGSNYGKTKEGISGGGSTERFPISLLNFPNDKQKSKLHPTQKPIALCSYLIRTYTNEGDLVLDNCTGAASIPISCIQTNRRFIAFELDSDIYEIATARVKNT